LEEVRIFSVRDEKQRERERTMREMCITQRTLIVKDALAGEKGQYSALYCSPLPTEFLI
jgi:hypothetical protein